MVTTLALQNITADEFIKLFEGEEEFALLDLSEEGEFATTPHLIQATNIPLSILEIRITELVPQRITKIIFAHNRNDVAIRAATILWNMGYVNICVLQSSDGLKLYTGFNVKSKAFGEIVEHHYSTPTQDAESVKKKINDGKCILIDVRPYREFNYETIPGAFNVTGSALYDVARKLIVSPGQEVVVNCGGRTRSIIGAQTLIELGVDYPVSSLKNGTMGWHLFGYELEYRATRGIADLPLNSDRAISPSKFEFLQEASLDKVISLIQLGKTVYFFDLRDPNEISASPFLLSRAVSSVQLIQATDCFCAVQNCTVILIDPGKTSASAVGRWLFRMGIRDIFMICNNLDEWKKIPAALSLEERNVAVPELNAIELKENFSDFLVVDFSNSQTHQKGHIPGSRFAIRSQIDTQMLCDAAGDKKIVFYGDNGSLLSLAAADHADKLKNKLFVFTGGLRAWTEAGGTVSTGMSNSFSEPSDVFIRPMELAHDREKAMKDYLDWEVDLIESIGQDKTLKFNL